MILKPLFQISGLPTLVSRASKLSGVEDGRSVGDGERRSGEASAYSQMQGDGDVEAERGSIAVLKQHWRSQHRWRPNKLNKRDAIQPVWEVFPGSSLAVHTVY